jgi:hypothetical protein
LARADVHSVGRTEWKTSGLGADSARCRSSRKSSGATGVTLMHARTDVLVDQQLECGARLSVEIAIDLVSVHESAPEAEERGHEVGHASGARAMANAILQ